MRKKILLAAIGLISVLAVTACSKTEQNNADSSSTEQNNGEDSSIEHELVISAGGNKYDLTAGFYEVVNNLVNDGIYVYDEKMMWSIDENGMPMAAGSDATRLSDLEEDDCAIMVSYANPDNTNNLVMPYYLYMVSTEYANDFITINGIVNTDNISDYDYLYQFYPLRVNKEGSQSYISLYYDNTLVDLNEYESGVSEAGYEELLTDIMFPEEESKNDTFFGIQKNIANVQSNPENNDISDEEKKEKVENALENKEYLTQELTLTMALMEGREKIENGDIDNMYLAWYTFNPDDSYLFFFLVYGDEPLDY